MVKGESFSAASEQIKDDCFGPTRCHDFRARPITGKYFRRIVCGSKTFPVPLLLRANQRKHHRRPRVVELRVAALREELVGRIESTKDLGKDDEAKLHEAIKDFKKNGNF